MIYVKYYDRKSGSIGITNFSCDYDPADLVTTAELLNTWVEAVIGHTSFVIEDFGPVLPDSHL